MSGVRQAAGRGLGGGPGNCRGLAQGGALLTDTSPAGGIMCGAQCPETKMCLLLFKTDKELPEGGSRALDPAQALLSTGTVMCPGTQPCINLLWRRPQWRGGGELVCSRGPERHLAAGPSLG